MDGLEPCRVDYAEEAREKDRLDAQDFARSHGYPCGMCDNCTRVDGELGTCEYDGRTVNIFERSICNYDNWYCA